MHENLGALPLKGLRCLPNARVGLLLGAPDVLAVQGLLQVSGCFFALQLSAWRCFPSPEVETAPVPRMCFSKKRMYVDQAVFMHFFLFFFFLNPGCGYSRLAPSVLQVAKTTSNNKRGEAERALRSRGVRAFKSSDRGGELGASLPAFARPRVCFKLLQALQPSLSERVSVRHLERGEGEGGLLLPFVCVWEEE